MLWEEQVDAIALGLFDMGAVRLGQFTLHSGLSSPIYIDLRLLASYPEYLKQAAAAYAHILRDLEFDLLSAAPLAGLPIGTALSLEMNKPLIYPRMKPKAHGTGNKIEGQWRRGQTVIVIDDLITSGDSLLQTIKILEEAGMRVAETAVLIDRGQGGKRFIENQGYILHSVMNIEQLLAVLVRTDKIALEEKDEILAALD